MFDLVAEFSFEKARQNWKNTRFVSVPEDKKATNAQMYLRGGETKPLTPAEEQRFKELTTLKKDNK